MLISDKMGADEIIKGLEGSEVCIKTRNKHHWFLGGGCILVLENTPPPNGVYLAPK